MRAPRVLLTLAFVLATATPGFSQSLFQGGILPNSATTASVNITNTVTRANLYSIGVPAITTANFTPQQAGAASLHVRLLGTLSTLEGTYTGALNVGCNYGGATATIALVNGATPPRNLVSIPLKIDLWLVNQGGTPILMGRWATSTTTAEASQMVSVVGTTNVGVAQILECSAQWGSAAAANSIAITHGIAVVGD